MGGVISGWAQVEDVDEAAISPSKCNKRKSGQSSVQIDKFNVLVYLYGNSATRAFTPLLLPFFPPIIHFGF